MHDGATIVAGIEIPSTNPLFLAIVAVHVFLGLVCVLTGAATMLSQKGPGGHPKFGTIYYWSLLALILTASILSFMRWDANHHLFVLGVFALLAATLGRTARRTNWPRWTKLHVIGMGTAYILMLTAFYVDNGKQIPVWKDLPQWTYWTSPAFVGVPLLVWAIMRCLPVALGKAGQLQS